MADLFEDQPAPASSGPGEPREDAPLADRLRPRLLAEVGLDRDGIVATVRTALTDAQAASAASIAQEKP